MPCLMFLDTDVCQSRKKSEKFIKILEEQNESATAFSELMPDTRHVPS